ncbi:MAG: matrixin family metalloprotease [Armatimonadetes bacterium]|nr:matrixin family metalloprotease [Armatimonadota bacterium]
MKHVRTLPVLAVLAIATSASAYDTLGTKWGFGPNVATHLDGHEGTPGLVTWSFMGGGLGIGSYEDHDGLKTGEMGMLVGTPMETEEVAMISAAFATWSSVAAITTLGPVMDGHVDGGAPEAMGGHLGDIRIGVIGGFSSSSVLAHAYLPGTEALYGAGGTLTGDLHFNITKEWVDDAFDADDGAKYDLQTVALHEIGHALGLGHSDVVGSVMYPTYSGGKRTLSEDDIMGIQYIYGVVPEPASAMVFGGAVWLALSKRRRRS